MTRPVGSTTTSFSGLDTHSSTESDVQLLFCPLPELGYSWSESLTVGRSLKQSVSNGRLVTVSVMFGSCLNLFTRSLDSIERDVLLPFVLCLLITRSIHTRVKFLLYSAFWPCLDIKKSCTEFRIRIFIL